MDDVGSSVRISNSEGAVDMVGEGAAPLLETGSARAADASSDGNTRNLQPLRAPPTFGAARSSTTSTVQPALTQEAAGLHPVVMWNGEQPDAVVQKYCGHRLYVWLSGADRSSIDVVDGRGAKYTVWCPGLRVAVAADDIVLFVEYVRKGEFCASWTVPPGPSDMCKSAITKHITRNTPLARTQPEIGLLKAFNRAAARLFVSEFIDRVLTGKALSNPVQRNVLVVATPAFAFAGATDASAATAVGQTVKQSNREAKSKVTGERLVRGLNVAHS